MFWVKDESEQLTTRTYHQGDDVGDHEHKEDVLPAVVRDRPGNKGAHGGSCLCHDKRCGSFCVLVVVIKDSRHCVQVLDRDKGGRKKEFWKKDSVHTDGTGAVNDGRDGGQGASGAAERLVRAQLRRHGRRDEGVWAVDQESDGHEEDDVGSQAHGAKRLVDEEHGDGHHEHDGTRHGAHPGRVAQHTGYDPADDPTHVEERRQVRALRRIERGCNFSFDFH